MPKINLKEIIIVFGILIFSLGIYIYKLSTIPNGVYVDETLNGYNAYSILQTGKDEYAKAFPIAFRLFGSYSPPLHIYLLVPFIKFLGLNATAIRLPSAISMTITVFLFYLSLKKIIGKKDYHPYLETFIFTFLPWSVFFARVGYEVTLSLPFFALSFLILLYTFEKAKLFPLAAFVLSILSYTSQTTRFLAPLYFLGVLFLYRKLLKDNWKQAIWGILIFSITQIPNLFLFLTPAFATKNSLFYTTDITQRAKGIPYLAAQITWPLAFIKEFFARFLAYFSPKSLFLNPDPDPQRSIPLLGAFYPYLIVPYLVGLYSLITRNLSQKSKLLIFTLIISPIPAALARDPFSTQRALPLFFPLSLLSFLGFEQIRAKINPLIFLPLMGCLIIFSALQLYRSYFILLPHERAVAWSYGFDKLAKEIKDRPDEQFLIDQSRIKPAYIELAFFLKLDPAIIQTSVDPEITNHYYENVVFDNSYSFAQITTRNIVWEKDIYQEQIIVGDNLTVSENQAKEHFLTKVFEIKDPVGEIIFVGYKTNPKLKCAATLNESPYCRN